MDKLARAIDPLSSVAVAVCCAMTLKWHGCTQQKDWTDDKAFAVIRVFEL